MTIAPTPTYRIFVDHKCQAPSAGSAAYSRPWPKSGMPISQPITPPIKISTATFTRTINPTANRAGETSPPKKKILFPLKNAVSSPPFNTPANEMRPLNAQKIIYTNEWTRIRNLDQQKNINISLVDVFKIYFPINKMLSGSHFHILVRLEKLLPTNVQCCENKIFRYISVCYMVWAQYVFWCNMEENIFNGI